MYICYLLLSLVSRLIRINIVIPTLAILSACGIALLVTADREAWLWRFLCCDSICKYLQFFTLGLFCSKYRERLFRLLSSNAFICAMTLGWIICMILWYNAPFKSLCPYAYAFVHDIAVRYFALMTVVSAFYGYRDKLSSDTKVGKTLGFIGQRTLDIYMIHYFFLPDLPDISAWLLTGNKIIFQITIVGAITIAITAVCLLISTLLRRSTTMASWLFGVKSPRPN